MKVRGGNDSSTKGVAESAGGQAQPGASARAGTLVAKIKKRIRIARRRKNARE
jgi:hypothetical protein